MQHPFGEIFGKWGKFSKNPLPLENLNTSKALWSACRRSHIHLFMSQPVYTSLYYNIQNRLRITKMVSIQLLAFTCQFGDTFIIRGPF